MTELDEVWSQMLQSAAENARSSGRHGLAEYLDLRSSNDALRRAAVKWLFDSMAEIGTDPAAARFDIDLVKDEPHNFDYRGANLVGSRLSLRYGVRCLSLEAGWPRTPKDGFIRGGAMAVAKLSHFGMPSDAETLLLLRPAEMPAWFRSGQENTYLPFGFDDLRRHFEILTR
jgi:hypothetical protein